MTQPLIVFDANETLLDLDAIADQLIEAAGKNSQASVPNSGQVITT